MRSALAQLRVEDVAQRVAEQIDAEHGQHDREAGEDRDPGDRKSTRLNSSHRCISYAVFCLKKKYKIVNFCVMESIKPSSLDTPIIFIPTPINFRRFVITCCDALTCTRFTFPVLYPTSIILL